LTFRTIAFMALVLALVSGGIYWFVSRPTAEERALLDFFDEFRHGKYEEAEDYTLNDDFYEMATSTKVRDTNGNEYIIGDYFPESKREILRHSIESYLRQHIARWKYLDLNTQRFEEDSEEAFVHFRVEIGIRDFTTGNIMGAVHEGRVEGTATMEMQDSQWRVKDFDFSLFSDEGMVLSNYLEQAH